MKRRMAATLGMVLLLSIAYFFAAAHRHEAEAQAQDSDCVACAWHHDVKFENPSNASLLTIPQAIWAARPEPPAASPSRPLPTGVPRGPPVAFVQQFA